MTEEVTRKLGFWTTDQEGLRYPLSDRLCRDPEAKTESDIGRKMDSTLRQLERQHRRNQSQRKSDNPAADEIKAKAGGDKKKPRRGGSHE